MTLKRRARKAPRLRFHQNSQVAEPPASFAGFLNQTEISRAYVAADCLVLPSDHGETWGLVVNEALASDLPCLVSDACGCAEDLVGQKLSFPMGDRKALAAKLERFLSHQPCQSSRRCLRSLTVLWQFREPIRI